MYKPKTNERRYLKIKEMRASTQEDEKILDGYAALFDTEADMDWYREVIRPKAFNKTLSDGADVRALQNHDPNYVLGRTKSETLKLAVDNVGLRFSITLPNTRFANDLWESVSRGDVDQASFGFQTIQDRWTYSDVDGELPVRELLEVKLFDVSVVTFPAYSQTTVSARDKFGVDFEKVAEKIKNKQERTEEERNIAKHFKQNIEEAGKPKVSKRQKEALSLLKMKLELLEKL